MNKENQSGEGYMHSVKLMLVAGLLILVALVGGNKLIYYHFHIDPQNQIKIISNLARLESNAFIINSYRELYLTWFFVVSSIIGLAAVIYRLLITWKK